MARAQILVAAGDPDFAGELAANLESLGFAVTAVVSSPEEAGKKTEEAPPDLVLLDLAWLREGKKGKAVRQLRKSFPQRLVYLVVDEDRATLKKLKITHSFDYLRKAGDLRELETIIDMALYRQQRGEELKGDRKEKGQFEEKLRPRDEKQTAQIGKITSQAKGGADRHQRLEEALQAERKKLYAVLDTLPAYVVLLAPDYSVPFANREFIKRFGASEGRKCYDFLFGRTSPCPDCETYKVLDTNAPHEWEWTGPDGYDYQIYDFPFKDTDGTTLILEMGVDVTVLKDKEAEVKRANRALKTLSAVNKAVVRAPTEAELLQDVCRVVVEEGGYRLAWIGYAENDLQKTVRPMAQAGYEEGYLETLKINWADTERGRGPTGAAIRTGQPVLARNIPTDPHFAPWREEAMQRGYTSSLVLPLMKEDAAFGALNIYAGDADAFDAAEVELLSDLAVDVSFGIMTLRGKEERRRMAAALRRSYEEMEARVQDRTQALATSNAALQMEISERLWSEKKLRESEGRYRSLVDLSPDAIAVQSQGRYLFINPAGVQLLGAANPAEVVALAVSDVVHPDYRELVSERICAINSPGAQTDLQEIKIVRLDGRVVDVEAAGVGITYQGQPAVLVMMRDITARKEMERRLEHMASFPRLNPHPVLEVDIAGNVTYFNTATQETLNKLKMDEGQVRAFLPPDLNQILKIARETGERVFHREVPINGAYFSETISWAPEFKVIRIYTTDITERKRAEMERQNLLEKLQVSEEELQATVEELQVQTEELQVQAEELQITNQNLHEAHTALQEREAQLQTIFDSLTEGLVVADLEGHLLHWNPAAVAMHGFASLAECQRFLPEFADIFELSTPEEDILPLAGWPLARILRGETLHNLEVQVRRLGTGWQRVFSYGGRLACDHLGQPLLAVTTVRDITESKRAEEELRFSHQRLDLLADTAGQLLASASPQEVVDGLCRKVMDFIGCDVCFNFLLDEQAERLHLHTCAGISPEEACKIEWIDSGAGLCGCSARDGCRIVAENIQESSDPRTGVVKSYGLQAYACHPLKVQDRVLGTLGFGSRKRSRFAPEELELMSAVADLVSIAMDRKLHEEALRESREDLNRAQAVAHTGSWRLDVQRNALTWSDENHRIFGIPRGTPMTYETFLATVHPEDRAYVDREWTAALRGEPYDIEHRIVVGDEVKWVRERAELEFDSQGRLLGGFGTTQDISERKLGEEALRREKRFSENVIESLPGVFYLFDSEGRFLKWNKNYECVSGYASEELAGMSPEDFFLGEDKHLIKQRVQEVFAKGEATAEAEFVSKDGRKTPYFFTGLMITLDQKKCLVGVGIDISSRKGAEESLSASKNFLEISNRHSRMDRLLQDYTAAVQEYTGCEAAAIRILDEEGNIPYEAHTGFSEEFIASESRLCTKYDRCLCINVVKGDTDPDLPVYTRGSSCYINNFSHLLATSPPGLLGETRNVCHQFGYESVALVPIIFGGEILGLIHLADHRENLVPLSLVERLERIAMTLGTAINRVRAEEGLRQALIDARQRQAEIAALLTATRAVLKSGDFPEITRSIYDSCKELIGATAGYIALLSPDGQANEVLFLDTGGRDCQVDPSLPMPLRGLRAEACQTCQTVYDNDYPSSGHARFLPPGHTVLDNVLFSPLVMKSRAVGLLGLGNKPGGFDENDVRLSTGFGELAAMALSNQRAEEEREKLIRELEMERARLQAIITSAPEAIVVADEQGRVLMTNPAADRLYSHPEGCAEDSPECALFQFCRENGTACVPGDQPLLRSAREGETHRNVEMVLSWPDGRRRDLLVNTAPIKDLQGLSSGAVGLFQDITRRKETEEKVRKLNLELSERIREVSERTLQLEAANKELEAFSYSVSHDLRTPLRAIEGFARILREDYLGKLDQEGLRLLEVIRSNTQIMAELIDDLLALSRLGRQEIRAQEIDLGGLVTSVFGELRAQMGERQIELILNPLPPAFGDRSLINQVLVNLLGNAVKFTQPREKAIIEVGGWTEGKENIYFIKDNGVGFDIRYVGKIFGVFQRLHRREDFDGTGVGLAIVQRIITRHGGRLWATGKVDSGASFYFTLPRKGEDR
ncbi:MAG: PAS domain S-box protein [Syntrophales bacterium]|nr:PAS domain S-box protein [Syntrophales bacterium]